MELHDYFGSTLYPTKYLIIYLIIYPINLFRVVFSIPYQKIHEK